MKAVIGLWGHANCGKSSTLIKLQEKLESLGERIYKESHHSETVKVYRYKNTVIGVAPGGDCLDVVNENIRIFKNLNCDICISATRTGGSGCIALEKYAKVLTDDKVRWFRMPYMDEYKNLYDCVQDGVADAIEECIECKIDRYEN